MAFVATFLWLKPAGAQGITCRHINYFTDERNQRTQRKSSKYISPSRFGCYLYPSLAPAAFGWTGLKSSLNRSACEGKQRQWSEQYQHLPLLHGDQQPALSVPDSNDVDINCDQRVGIRTDHVLIEPVYHLHGQHTPNRTPNVHQSREIQSSSPFLRVETVLKKNLHPGSSGVDSSNSHSGIRCPTAEWI